MKRSKKLMFIPAIVIAAIIPGYYYGVTRVTAQDARQIAHTALLNAGYNPEFITPNLLTVKTLSPDIPYIFILHPPTWLVTCKYRDPNSPKVELMKEHGLPQKRQAVNVSIYVLKTTGKCTGIREWFGLRGVSDIHQEWIKRSSNFP
jgi:hypothetical protein